MKKAHPVTHRIYRIQVKIGVTMILLNTLIFFGFGLYQYLDSKQQETKRLVTFASRVASQLSVNLVSPLWDIEVLQVQRAVEAEMQDENILMIVVKDQTQKRLTAKTRDEAWHVVDAPTNIASPVSPTVAEVVREQKSIGTVDVYLTDRFLQAQLRMTMQKTALMAVVCDGVLFGLFLVSMRLLLIRPLACLLTTANAIAAGDFSRVILIRQHDEIGALAQAFGEMQAKVAEVVCDVKTSAQDVALRSRELSVVAEQMSEGASQQAAATEEVSASMQEMADNIRQTADNAKLTEGIAVQSAEDARAGKQAVTEIIKAMEVVADRISVVKEIANQTNMLSLNATIEAVKAQDYGKGFSVVASAVRELARESRAAAEEIRALVNSCVVLSAQAGDVLQRLVPSSEKTAELVQEINAATQEQANGVEHVNQAVQQLDTVTQHNAATSEELASTAENLTTQADALQQAMAFFTVPERRAAAPAMEDHDLLTALQTLAAKGASEQALGALVKSMLPAALPALATPKRRDDAAPPQTPNPSEPPASASGAAIHLHTPNTAGDERDQEFEHY